MKKLILKLLWSALGREIARVILNHFLRKLAQRGYYMTSSAADARSSTGTNYGNVLNHDIYRASMIDEFVELDLQDIKP